jgi:hypothetical protein
LAGWKWVKYDTTLPRKRGGGQRREGMQRGERKEKSEVRKEK